MNEKRPSTDRAVVLFVAISVAGGLCIAAFATHAFMLGRITLKNSIVTELEKPFLFYFLTALLGLLAILMFRAGLLTAIKHFGKRG
jgi:thiol:disulfide interchange protein